MSHDHHSTKFDIYQNAWAKSPEGNITLANFIEAIRSDEYANPIATVRASIAAGELKAVETAKKKLPAASISGETKGARAKAMAENRFTHSGFLQIDLDAKDNPSWSVADMRASLIADPHIIAVFASPSGNGVKAIAAIAPNATLHLSSYLAAEAHFAKLGLAIDRACKDPVRLCFLSHDPDAWLRDDIATPFIPEETADEITAPPDTAPRHARDHDHDDTDTTPTHAAAVTSTGGLVIRRLRPQLDATTIRAMLRHIPYPGFDEWLKITNSVWKALGIDAGTAILQEWAPEKREGDYAKHAKTPLADITEGTLFFHAQANGWCPPSPPSSAVTSRDVTSPTAKPTSTPPDKNAIPDHIFPVPNGDITNELAARHIFTLIAPTNRLFSRNTTIHEVIIEHNEPRLEPVKSTRFASLIEEFGQRVMIREKREDGTPRWRAKLMAANHCEVLLQTTAARDTLPRIQQITGSPVLAWTNDGPQLLSYGWSPHAGGTYVTGRQKIPTISIDEAMSILFDEVLIDIDFASAGDAARAAASFISPALKIGRWIDDDFPIDVAEADQSQAGKSYRHKLIAAVFGEIPYTITNATGGVGSLDERIGGALIAGRPIVTLENIRGRIDSQILESAIRGQSRVTARTFRACVEVETAPFLWQLSTNGTELTKDLANRAVITRIRKQAPGYIYHSYPEGEILHHIRAHQPRYLAAIHAILRAWGDAGRPRTAETRHDFRGWVRSLDWIVQNILGLTPLMEDHQEQQQRTANPKLQWLRDVLRAMLATELTPLLAVTASDLVSASEEHDLPVPGRRRDSEEKPESQVGRILAKLYKDANAEQIIVDGIALSRQVTYERDAFRHTTEKKTYVISKVE
jgi:VirE N-terminal domain